MDTKSLTPPSSSTYDVICYLIDGRRGEPSQPSFVTEPKTIPFSKARNMRVGWSVYFVATLYMSWLRKASSFISWTHPSTRTIKAVPLNNSRRKRLVFQQYIPSNVKLTSLNVSPDTGRKLVTMGRIPWKKLNLSKSQGREIISIIRSETHTIDLSLMIVLAFFSEKIGKFLFRRVFSRIVKYKDYDISITKKVEENLGQIAKLGLVCYILDAFEIVLEVAGIKGKKTDFSTLAAKLIYATWIVFRARIYKRHFFEAAFDYASKINQKSKNKALGKVDVVDKVS